MVVLVVLVEVGSVMGGVEGAPLAGGGGRPLVGGVVTRAVAVARGRRPHPAGVVRAGAVLGIQLLIFQN